MPADAYALQATLSNGRRADALIRLPDPPGPIVVDAKFPLEAYEAMTGAESDAARTRAAREFARAVQHHIRAIAGRYVVEGETADSALMFIPSEAVFAELHARHGAVVREGFASRVWTVSPTTLMAVLHTMRGVMKDARVTREADRIRRELGLLQGDLARLAERAQALETHFERASRDLDQLKVSAEKAGRRAGRLESLDFAGEAPERRAGVSR